MHIPILLDIVVIIGLATAVSLICQKLKIPSIVGFLITGAIAGPSGFSLVSAVHEVETMAEIGVILLLFSIGLEFSLKHLLQIRKAVLLGGFLQVVLTTAVTAVIMQQLGFKSNAAIFAGFLVALSSTAIVLNQLQKQAAMDAPHGRVSLAILIFQDIIIVPMMIFTPFLAGQESIDLVSLAVLLLKIILLLLLIFAGSRWLIPLLFFRVARTQNREMFIMAIVFTVFAIAWLTATIGLSLALGAFMAGLMISESEYSHDAVSHILPFRDIFISFFFVSVGMLLNSAVIISHWPLILGAIGLIVLVKFLIAGSATIILGFPGRIAVLVGLSLAQIGEFSFILAKSGYDSGLLSSLHYQVFLAITVLMMILTPFMISSGKYADKIVKFMPLTKKMREGRVKEVDEVKTLNNHIIIIGFGVIGRNVAHAAQSAHLPYVIMEMNPETVQREKHNGEPIYFGDASYPQVLHTLGTEKAKVLVVAISDIAATRRIVFLSKLTNPELMVIARARFQSEIEPLQELGADQVIAEEFEASIEIFSRVLDHYSIDINFIQALDNEVRNKGYQQLRQQRVNWPAIEALKLSDSEVRLVKPAENCMLINKSLKEVNFRQTYKLNLLAIRRNDKLISNPGAEQIILPEDNLIVFGHPQDIVRLESEIQ
ncbi:MAG: cation:proton antiporter [Calditrichae bacterium]|nr:cation:proton antiporter [Calditrichota bacterium]MCB9057933.1 cation:proton antiporter [Calditrichia bacterium]